MVSCDCVLGWRSEDPTYFMSNTDHFTRLMLYAYRPTWREVIVTLQCVYIVMPYRNDRRKKITMIEKPEIRWRGYHVSFSTLGNPVRIQTHSAHHIPRLCLAMLTADPKPRQMRRVATGRSSDVKSYSADQSPLWRH